MASDTRLRSALSSSASRRRRRRSPSSASTSLTAAGDSPRATSPRSTASGCSRKSRRSSTSPPLLPLGGLLDLLGLHAGNRPDTIVGLEVDDPDPPGVAALRGDVGDADADDLSLGRDDEQIVPVP